jgi:hypothetical protein
MDSHQDSEFIHQDRKLIQLSSEGFIQLSSEGFIQLSSEAFFLLIKWEINISDWYKMRNSYLGILVRVVKKKFIYPIG